MKNNQVTPKEASQFALEYQVLNPNFDHYKHEYFMILVLWNEFLILIHNHLNLIDTLAIANTFLQLNLYCYNQAWLYYTRHIAEQNYSYKCNILIKICATSIKTAFKCFVVSICAFCITTSLLRFTVTF